MPHEWQVGDVFQHPSATITEWVIVAIPSREMNGYWDCKRAGQPQRHAVGSYPDKASLDGAEASGAIHFVRRATAEECRIAGIPCVESVQGDGRRPWWSTARVRR